MYALVLGLVRAKRTGLTNEDLTDEELVNFGITLLSAGLDTTANMISPAPSLC